jgi:Glycosyltransferase family 28 C-terminal domain
VGPGASAEGIRGPEAARPAGVGGRVDAGARAINAAVSGAAAALRATGVQVLHITGPQHVVEVPDGDPADLPYVVIPCVDEMQYAYAAADFVICRSGAMTCAELAAVGLPAAYVPGSDSATPVMPTPISACRRSRTAWAIASAVVVIGLVAAGVL